MPQGGEMVGFLYTQELKGSGGRQETLRSTKVQLGSTEDHGESWLSRDGRLNSMLPKLQLPF